MCSNLKKFIFLLFILQNYCFADENKKQLIDLIVPAVNQNLKQNKITKHGLGAIFKMRLLEWKDGTTVTVFVLADEQSLHTEFCKKVLSVFPYQMRKSWNQLVFSGSGQAPIELNSKEEMISKLISTTGAIGYLRTSDLKEGVKKLHIQSGSQY